ncbi:MAG: DUF5606 domain-containing protein [Muribaculaceae bacterium]|nr:DUF5606 domain-containing protein [Muribaculaceae bacterium]
MLKGIIAITGKPGLYKLLCRGKNSLIVESLSTGKRVPSYATDKVISLADVTMYADHGDVPLSEVLTSLYTVAEGKPVDIKGFADDAAIRDYFAKVLPDFERDRVYTADIRKLFTWYNQLIAAGVTDFKDEEIAEDNAAEAAEAADAPAAGDPAANYEKESK